MNQTIDKIAVKKPGRKTENLEILKRITALKKGESTVVKRKEWHTLTRPGQHMLRKQTGRECRTEPLADDWVWLITAL